MCGLVFTAELRNYKHQKISDVHVRCWRKGKQENNNKQKPVFLPSTVELDTTIKVNNTTLQTKLVFKEQTVTERQKYLQIQIQMDRETRRQLRQLFAQYFAAKLEREQNVSDNKETIDRLPISLDLRQFSRKYIVIYTDTKHTYTISLYKLIMLLQRSFREQGLMFLHTGTRMTYVDIKQV